MENKAFLWIEDMVRCLSGIELLLEDRAGLGTALLSRLPGFFHHARIVEDLETGIRRIQPNCVYEIRGMFDLHYLVVYDRERDCYLSAGPCLLGKPNLAELRSQMQELDIGAQWKDSVVSFCKNLPQVTYDIFQRLGTLLAQWLLPEEEMIQHHKLDYRWDGQTRKLLFQPDQYADLSHMRKVEQRYENSSALTEAVKCGNLSLAYSFMQAMSSERDSLARHPDPLRNQKNICIILNTQLRYALEDAGIHPYVLDRTSGQIALDIEAIRTVQETELFAADIIRQYCELVQTHSYAELKPFSLLAVTYIKNHLGENLTVKDTARALLVNPDYLSDRFHKEVGLTFIDFVNRERTSQAANLLRNTPMQIQQVASLVGYNNTSYFSKQFFRFYGQTPRDYRRGRG